MGENEKIESFTSAITADAIAESNRIYEEIKKESEATLSHAEDESLKEAFNYIKVGVSKIRTEIGRKTSKQVMEHKRALYTRREEMRRAVLLDVRKKLTEYCKSKQYQEQLSSMLDDILQIFQAETLVELTPQDMPLSGKLSKKQYPVTFKAGNFELGGLRAYCSSKGLEIDQSFDTKLSELGSHFSELMGLELSDSIS